MSILSYNNINVKNEASGFTLAGMNDALMGINISGPVSPPLGVSPLAFSVSSNTSRGGLSEKPNLSNQDNLAFLDNLSGGFPSDSLLQFIHRQMSAFDVPLSETVQNSFLKFLQNNLSLSDLDKEFRVGIALAYIKAGASDKADTFLLCGTGVAIMSCESCGYQHPVSFNCKLRICPRCSRIRASELTAKYQSYLVSLDPRRVRCITLSLKNVKCLESGVSKIRRCFVKLLHRKDYKKSIKGGLYHIEATVGNDGLWHVHLHCIVVGDYITQKKLSKAWESITAKEFGIGSPVAWVERKEVKATLKYCMKHLLKKMKLNDNWTPEKLVEYEMALTNVRLVQPFGCFLGVLKDYKKKPFECPVCGESVWRITSLSGETIVSPLNRMLREYDKVKSPSTPSLCFISDG